MTKVEFIKCCNYKLQGSLDACELYNLLRFSRDYGMSVIVGIGAKCVASDYILGRVSAFYDNGNFVVYTNHGYIDVGLSDIVSVTIQVYA